ncbi:MAG: FxLYD domain-containing protein [Candidatus Omnitrophica bacterium]|nr:FxLYD domain-containing protein [Candidatus Omnitrophota bacterium]
MNFSYYNIDFRRYGDGKYAYVSGEVTNESLKDYETAAFRIVLFDQTNRVIWSGSFKIRGLGKKRTKSFEVPLEGVDFTIIPKISRYDIYFESGY